MRVIAPASRSCVKTSVSHQKNGLCSPLLSQPHPNKVSDYGSVYPSCQARTQLSGRTQFYPPIFLNRRFYRPIQIVTRRVKCTLPSLQRAVALFHSLVSFNTTIFDILAHSLRSSGVIQRLLRLQRSRCIQIQVFWKFNTGVLANVQ